MSMQKTHSEPSEIKTALIEQLYKPVRWVDVMKVVAETSDQVIESGPGQSACGLKQKN